MPSHYEIFKLKAAGMTNLGINKLLKFEHQHQKAQRLSPRQMAQIAECRDIAGFIEKYTRLDDEKLTVDFERFPSFSILDDCYPDYLKEIYDPPTLLFYRGRLELLKLPKIAFVGSRDATDLGRETVKKLVLELKQQFVIVSGLARGIDSYAHIEALHSHTPTIAVLGTGLDSCYPAENHVLQDFMAQRGLLLTEYPVASKPLRYHFPERNRIIAGLSQAVLVIEAKLRSGSLITAERALEEGREVFAVPGNILDGRSCGCHLLIQQGAKLINSGQDILEEITL